MAASKSALLIISAVLLLAAVATAAGHQRHLLASLNCGAACTVKCAESPSPSLCKRACGACCARCGCVRPGVAGRNEMCPCYNDQVTHGGGRFCP